MKHIFTFLICLFMVAVCTASAPLPAGTEPGLLGTAQFTKDGTAYLVKSYELAPEEDTARLILPDFEQEGFFYRYQGLEKNKVPYTETKTAAQSVTLNTPGNNLREILKQLAGTIDYSADGYQGTLYLNTGTIKTEPRGYQSTAHPHSATRTYPGLAQNDPALVPPSITENGLTLNRTGLSWRSEGSAPDSLIPASFTAIATYGGTTYSKTATGYVTTAVYTGEVSKTGIRKVAYTVTYAGEKIPPNIPWQLLSALGAGTAFLLLLLLLLRYAFRYNTTAYVTVPGTQRNVLLSRHKVSRNRPAIYLSGIGDESRIQIVVKKRAAKKMLGHEIIIFRKGRPAAFAVDAGNQDFWMILSGKERIYDEE